MAAPAGGDVAPAAPTAPVVTQESSDDVLRAGSRFGPEDDPYELGEEVGSGAAARVYVCTRVRTGEKNAAKVINLQRLRLMGDFEAQMIKLNREVQILRELHHPRIVNLHFVHRTKNWIFLVMELVRGGELFDQIVRNRTLQEMEAKYIFSQLLDGVGYMHSRHVIHRDLKPENILIVASTPAPAPETGQLHDVKIADFGLSKVINDGSSMAKTFVGTPQYWAPEVLNVQSGGSYTQAADFWSLGAVLFVMLCGRYPFDGKKMPLEEQIRTATYNMNTAVWQRTSDAAKDMVRGLLKVNPQERMSLEACRRHPWLTGGSLPPPPPPPPPGPIVTEVSSGNVNSGSVPMVTHPSTTSELSYHSEAGAGSQVHRTSPEGSMHIEQTASQEQKAGERSEPYPQQKVQVPSIQVGDGKAASSSSPGAGAAEHETIFCLNELLKLQVSIAGSLEMACLAFRHADIELSDAIRRTFWQARDLFSNAATVVSQYAEVAQQVGQLVLADLKLAVDEKEPSLAVSLLGMVKGWVANMKKDGEEIQRQYMGLQESVHGLIRRAQHTKTDADRRLAEAVQAVEAEPAPPPSPRTTQQYLTNGPEAARGGAPQPESSAGAAAAGVSLAGMASASSAPIVFGNPSPKASSGTLNVPFSMSVWTKQLFEQLSHAQGGGSGGSGGEKTQDFSMVESAGGRAPMSDIDNETWKRDVLELLFMAPGVTPAQLPKFEQLNFQAEAVGGAVRTGAEQEHRPAEEVTSPTPRAQSMTQGDVPMGGGGSEGEAANSSGGADVQMEEAIVRFVPTSAEKSAAEAVTQSSASLLRALRELKRVDEILHGCSAFWANMDGTVQKLAQMKEHTETLVNFAANSKALKQRFEQRLGEYTNFWVSLERVCRQYCMDHQAASKRMYEVIREVADAADVYDTAQSARMGMVLAMSQKQRRHVGSLQY